MLVEEMLQSIPATSYAYHHVIAEYPNEDECFRIADTIFALRDPNHGKLTRTRASLDEIPHHFVETFQVVGDNLNVRTVHEDWSTTLETIISGHRHILRVSDHSSALLLLPAFLLRSVTGQLPVYLQLELNKNGNGHSQRCAAPSHFQQTENHMTLVLARDQIFRFEHEAV